jgi:hypothetical protein
MALTRRSFLLGVPCVALATACAVGGHSTVARKPYTELAHTKSAAQGAPKVVVFMPDTAQTREVWIGLSDELSHDFELVAVLVDGAGGADAMAKALALHRPSSVVLMNNPTVAAYREHQKRVGESQLPPAVIVMTSFLEEQNVRIPHATGIAYEVPLITVVTHLRRVIASPVERVGVVHRASLGDFVARQGKLAAREQIRVVSEQVSQEPNASELKRAIRRIKQQGAHALWVLNDDRLLSPKLIAQGWLPGLNERPWIPTIVGAASLVSAAGSFGTFAVLPDHTALGAQAAELVLEIADNGWSLPEDTQVQLPLSTTTAVDFKQAEERFALRSDALSQVDSILR